MAKKQTQDSGQTATATAETPAAPTVVQDPRPATIGASLFPEEFTTPTQDETPATEQPAEESPAQEAEAQPDPVKEAPSTVEDPAPTQAVTPPAVPDILDLSVLQGKKLRVKVDGIDMEVPAEDFVKNYQLEMHLNRKGQMLNEQKRAIEELRKELLTKAQTQTDAVEQAIEDGEAPQEIQVLRQELQSTQQALAEIRAATADIVFEKNVSALDSQVKANLGFDDFRQYVPKIQQFVQSQLVNPGRPTPQELARFDTPEFYLMKYQEMKLRDLRATPPAPAPKPAETAPPTPVLKKIVTVESGGGALPAKASESMEQQLQTAFDRARKSGSTDDWAEYYALKRSAG